MARFYLFTLMCNFFIWHSPAFAECSTKEKLDEEQNYVSCTVTIDGKTTEEKISETSCAALCDLQKVQNMNATYREFSGLKQITVKPGETKQLLQGSPILPEILE